MAKSNRIKIKLMSTSKSKHFYTTTKNKRNTTSRLKLKKYDPIYGKHVMYEEKKIN